MQCNKKQLEELTYFQLIIDTEILSKFSEP